MEIAPIEVFYFNICMNSMLNRKTAFSISVDSENDIKTGIINLFHNYPEFNSKDIVFDLYTNLSHIPPTIYSLKHGINKEYAQLTRLIIENPSIIVREFILPFNDCNDREFVLTYTALASIHLLGVSIKECNMCNIVIPDSVLNEAKKEAKSICDIYNRELVMSVGVVSDNLFVSESDENNKRITIKAANSFMNFVSGFIDVENKNDMQIPQLNNNEMIDLLGICDYDSLIIAHQRKSVLVTGEMLPAEITQLNEMKADVVGIADFLCLLKLPAIRLISIIGKMIDYRFNAAITPTVIIYLSNCYDASDVSTQERIIKDWENLLNSLNQILDENQRNNYKSTCIEVIRLLNGFKQGEGHPIVRAYIMFSFHYNDYRIHHSFENGKIISTVYKIDNASSTMPSKAISRIETSISFNEDSFLNNKS